MQLFGFRQAGPAIRGQRGVQRNEPTHCKIISKTEKDWQVFEKEAKVGVAIRIPGGAGSPGRLYGRQLGRMQGNPEEYLGRYDNARKALPQILGKNIEPHSEEQC